MIVIVLVVIIIIILLLIIILIMMIILRIVVISIVNSIPHWHALCTYRVTAMRHVVCRANRQAYYFTISATIWAQVIKPVQSVLELDATVPACLRIEKNRPDGYGFVLSFTDLNGNNNFCVLKTMGALIIIVIRRAKAAKAERDLMALPPSPTEAVLVVCLSLLALLILSSLLLLLSL